MLSSDDLIIFVSIILSILFFIFVLISIQLPLSLYALLFFSLSLFFVFTFLNAFFEYGLRLLFFLHVFFMWCWWIVDSIENSSITPRLYKLIAFSFLLSFVFLVFLFYIFASSICGKFLAVKIPSDSLLFETFCLFIKQNPQYVFFLDKLYMTYPLDFDTDFFRNLYKAYVFPQDTINNINVGFKHKEFFSEINKICSKPLLISPNDLLKNVIHYPINLETNSKILRLFVPPSLCLDSYVFTKPCFLADLINELKNQNTVFLWLKPHAYFKPTLFFEALFVNFGKTGVEVFALSSTFVFGLAVSNVLFKFLIVLNANVSQSKII